MPPRRKRAVATEAIPIPVPEARTRSGKKFKALPGPAVTTNTAGSIFTAVTKAIGGHTRGRGSRGGGGGGGGGGLPIPPLLQLIAEYAAPFVISVRSMNVTLDLDANRKLGVCWFVDILCVIDAEHVISSYQYHANGQFLKHSLVTGTGTDDSCVVWAGPFFRVSTPRILWLLLLLVVVVVVVVLFQENRRTRGILWVG